MPKLVLSKGYSARGADMGRRSVLPANAQEPIKLQMERLRWVSYDYDQGGAYWGWRLGDFIYCAHADNVQIFVRARTRDWAKALVRERLPKATFYR
jgi:hypothetical protein